MIESRKLDCWYSQKAVDSFGTYVVYRANDGSEIIATHVCTAGDDPNYHWDDKKLVGQSEENGYIRTVNPWVPEKKGYIIPNPFSLFP